MAVALDSSALLARYVGGPTRPVVVEAMDADPDWCASALALSEVMALIERAALLDADRRLLRGAVLEDWDRFWVIPVDQRCLDRAADLSRDHPVRTVDALHLAAADRLPRPVTYCTFDARQIPVALAMGFDLATA